MDNTKDSKNKSDKGKDTSCPEHPNTSVIPQRKIQGDKSKDKSEASNRNQEEVKESRIKKAWAFVRDPNHSGAVVAIFTIVIAFTGMVYTGFSAAQWFVIKSQLGEMQSTNRPYVFLIPLLGHPMTANFSDIAATVGAGNFGNSPAIDVTFSDPIIGLDTDPDIVKGLLNCRATYPVGGFKGILPPSQLSKGIGATAHTVTRAFTIDERNAVINGTRRVTVFGGVKYSGIRGGDYETVYCIIWDPKSASDPQTLAWHDSPVCPCTKIK